MSKLYITFFLFFAFTACNKDNLEKNNYGKIGYTDYFFNLTVDSNDQFQLTSNLSNVQGLPFNALGKLSSKITKDSGYYCSVQILDSSKTKWFNCNFLLPKLATGDSFVLDSAAYTNGISSNFNMSSSNFSLDAFSFLKVKEYSNLKLWPMLKFKIIEAGKAYPTYNAQKKQFENIEHISCLVSGIAIKQVGTTYQRVSIKFEAKLPILVN